MPSKYNLLSGFRRCSIRMKVLLLVLPFVAAASFLALGQATAPSIPALVLSADPLYAPSAVDKPALALALSVEFPTVGAQYVDPDNRNDSTTVDDKYSPGIEYLGYYDAESCYTYNKTGSDAPTGQEENYKRFVRAGPAIPLSAPDTSNPTRTSRMCWDGGKSYTKDGGTFSNASNDAFSGNFLNWASSSAIDMLRLAMTGGDRLIDTPTLTVLQRALIPNGDPMSMGNSSNFPSKTLYANGTSVAITSSGYASPAYVSNVPYFGALPNSMATQAAGQNVIVANTLNRIYFGVNKTGHTSSDFNGVYILGGAPPAVQKGPSSTYAASLPADAVLLGNEGQTYAFSGTREIWFGRNDATTSNWTVLPASGGIDCYWTGGGGPYGGIADPRSGVAKQCYSRPYTGTWTPTVSTTTPQNNDGFFYARVQVCDRDASTYALKDKRYWNLCSIYSDGATTPHPTYKPTGVVQKYADQLRLAAFGYVMDPSTSRVGGVLRAPMGYVGAKTFDVNGVDVTPATGNPKREWDPLTGVFYPNPESNTSVLTADGRASYLSGVVNYLNQFGRTGSVQGRYKTYDPVGELHYETVRYLQGLQPTAAAISSLSTDMYDGYPVYTTWTDPYGGGRLNSADYSCVKSNIVVIADKNTWDYQTHVPTASAANNIPDIPYWQGVAANFESNTSSNYVDGGGATRTTANPNTANTQGLGSASGYVSIVGSAYWAHTHDIRGAGWTNATTAGTAGTTLQRPGLRVKTFVFDVNEYGGSNDANTRHSSNQLFRAAKYGGFEGDPSNTDKNPYNTYGNPFVNEKDGSNNNYVWADTDTRTSRVGEANTYFLQSDPRAVLSAFDDIFKRAATAARSIAGGAIQSKNLTQVGDTIYQGTFDTSDWSGDLVSIPVVVSSTNVVSVGTTFNWTAATQLAGLTAPATSRNIVVGNAGATKNPVASLFTWTGIAAETSLVDALNKSGPNAAADGLGQDRLNYLRGDRSKEGSVFRTRSKLMGDVINSGVAYSGKPTSSISDSGYSAFYTAHAARSSVVYVGANDGMLHAFDAALGDELFAYIPSWMGSKLSALTSASYLTSHQSYVDGTPVVGEAKVGSDWKTVLVAGTGAGGKGVFALDVTTPTAFSASNVMWEFTNADDADLGNVIGRPQILKLRTSGTGASAVYKWFAVFGGGVNNYVSDGGIFSSTGNPSLFLLDLGKAAGDAWTLGTNYFKITLPVDSTLSAAKATGLLNFSVALGNSREVAQVFMGDLHGKLWKLDFTLAGSSGWNMATLSYYKQGTSNTPIPMFMAKDAAGNVQPISAAPTLAYGNTPGTYSVMFGTGKYLESGDRSSTATQSEYMVYDNGSNAPDSTASTATSAISSRLRLKQPTSVNTSTGVVTFPAFTVGRASTNTDSDNPRSGWVFNLPTSGERQVSNGTIFGASVIFASLIPGSGSAAACAVSGGGGNQYTIDILGGNGSFVSSQVGILGEPLVAEISSATSYTAADSAGRRFKTVTNQVFQQGSGGIAPGGTVTRQVVVGRLSWRQINNYQDLKNAP